MAFPLRSLLHAIQLMPPEPFERARPVVKRTDRPGVGPIQHTAALAPDVDQSNIPQDAQVLRDGWLLKAQARHNIPDRALLRSEIVQDLSPPGLGDRVERVRCGIG